MFIRYEDLLNDFNTTLFKIKEQGLQVKKNINFPFNTILYKNTRQKFVKKSYTNNISTEFILRNSNLIPLYEEKLYNLVMKKK